MQLAPLGQIGLAGKHVAKDHAVTFEQHPASGFDGAIPFDRVIGIEQRPAPGTVPRAGSASAALSGAALGIDERAQIVEAIGGYHSGGNQFPQSSFNFRFQFVGAANNVGEEGRAALAQKIQHLPRPFAQAARFGICVGRDCEATSNPRLRARRM